MKALSNIDIDAHLKDVDGFLGCYMKDELVKLKPLENGQSIVFNLNNHNQPGSHWTCAYRRNDVNYYFDSFGMMPATNIIQYLRRNHKEIIYSSNEIQNIKSQACGYYCIDFIKGMNNGDEIYDILYKFNNDGSINNDTKLLKYI